MLIEEKAYRSVVNRLGIAMLVLFGGMTVYRTAASEVLPLLLSGLPVLASNIIGELLLALLYSAAFLVPVFLFYGISRGKPCLPFDATLQLPKGTLLYLFASLGVISAAVYINAYVLDIFEMVSIFQREPGVPAVTAPRAAHQLILAFITTAVVPAFVEEALFRGVVLKNLLPFGRTTAVFASALLFGVMHQSAAQFFYATVAGVVIGYVYAYTKSIWCCVLIHFCNNAFSVYLTILRERLSLKEAALADSLSYLVVVLLGILAAVILLSKHRDRRGDLLQNGCFERDLAPDAEYAAAPLPMARRVKIFFTPPMLVFLVLCAVEIVYMLGMAVLF